MQDTVTVEIAVFHYTGLILMFVDRIKSELREREGTEGQTETQTSIQNDGGKRMSGRAERQRNGQTEKESFNLTVPKINGLLDILEAIKVYVFLSA